MSAVVTHTERPLRKKKRQMLPLLLIAPSVLLLTVLVAFPLVFSLRNSFYFWNLQMSPKPLGFIGLGNYRAAIQQSDFFEALRHTLEIALIGTAIEVAAGLAIAHLLAVRLVGIDLCRALLIMPTTIAPIVTGFLFRYMYDAQGGVIPWLIRGRASSNTSTRSSRQRADRALGDPLRRHLAMDTLLRHHPLCGSAFRARRDC